MISTVISVSISRETAFLILTLFIYSILDMTFREDEQRKRANHAAANFAIVRKIVLNLLKKRYWKRIFVL